ncbi:hypothetical protein BH23PAT2_BH23PAT2_09600 [soil metagenome]
MTYGLVSTSNYVLRNGTIVAGKISGNINPVAIPNSNHLLTQSGGNNYIGHNFYKYSSVKTSLDTKQNATGSVTHTLVSTPTPFPTSETGNPVRIRRDTVSFSGNGQWFLAESNRDFVRVNTETDEPFFFGDGYSYASSRPRPRTKTAVSSDGNFAVVGSGHWKTFRLYDLTDCVEQEDNYHDCAYYRFGKRN